MQNPRKVMELGRDLGSGLTNGRFAATHHHMSRKPRIHFSGAVYHVMLRGNGGRDIFFSSADRTKMFFLKQEGVERYGHRIHTSYLMSNHVPPGHAGRRDPSVKDHSESQFSIHSLRQYQQRGIRAFVSDLK